MSKYFDKGKNRTLFISDGISDGREWGTFYRKANRHLKRLVSPALPMRRSKEEALDDLDYYAVRKKLTKVA